MIACKYFHKTKSGISTCLLGWFGGRPEKTDCEVCISKKQNNREARLAADARAERSHPSTAKRVSGCCDSAKNYI